MLTVYLFLVAFAGTLLAVGGTAAAIICAVVALALVFRYELRTLHRTYGPGSRAPQA